MASGTVLAAPSLLLQITFRDLRSISLTYCKSVNHFERNLVKICIR